MPEQFVPGRPCLSRLAIKHSQHGPNLTRHCSKHATAAREECVCAYVRTSVRRAPVCMCACVRDPGGRPPFSYFLAFSSALTRVRHHGAHTSRRATSKTVKGSSVRSPPARHCLCSSCSLSAYVSRQSMCVFYKLHS